MAEKSTELVALMSIHPGYAEGLVSGVKRVEFRRVAPRDGVSHVLIYATQPVAAIVGGFEVEVVDRRSPVALWNKYRKVGGIDRSAFFEYFSGKDIGAALVVGRSWRCNPPVRLGEDQLPSRPPQSFMYLQRDVLERLAPLAAE